MPLSDGPGLLQGPEIDLPGTRHEPEAAEPVRCRSDTLRKHRYLVSASLHDQIYVGLEGRTSATCEIAHEAADHSNPLELLEMRLEELAQQDCFRGVVVPEKAIQSALEASDVRRDRHWGALSASATYLWRIRPSCPRSCLSAASVRDSGPPPRSQPSPRPRGTLLPDSLG